MGNCNLDGSPKLPIEVPSHVPYRPIWGNDVLRFMEKKKSLMMDYPNMWNFESKTLIKTHPMQ
jgi:hypothetical protein